MVFLQYGYLIIVAGVLGVFKSYISQMIGKVEHISKNIVVAGAFAIQHCLDVSLRTCTERSRSVGEEVQNVVGILIATCTEHCRSIHIFGGGYVGAVCHL